MPKRQHGQVGAVHHSAKLTEKDVIYIRTCGKDSVTLSKELDICSGHIRAIRHNKAWKSVDCETVDTVYKVEENWTVGELAYLAGLIDGEGTISVHEINRNKKPIKYWYIGMTVTITNTHYDSMKWVCSKFGGSLCEIIRKGEARNKHKNCLTWRVGSQLGGYILKKVLPYLIIKKEQAKLYIECSDVTKRRGDGHLPMEILELRKRVIDKMRKLNKRGADAEAA